MTLRVLTSFVAVPVAVVIALMSLKAPEANAQYGYSYPPYGCSYGSYYAGSPYNSCYTSSTGCPLGGYCPYGTTFNYYQSSSTPTAYSCSYYGAYCPYVGSGSYS